MHNIDCKTPYIDIYIDLLLIYCPYTVGLWLPSDQWFWNQHFTNNHIIIKYIILSNINSVVSDKVLRVCIQEPLLISKKLIVHLHTLSAYNSLLVRCKVHSSDPRECLCTSWTYAEAYENFSIEPAPCQKNPITKIKIVVLNFQPLLLVKYYWNKSVGAKVCLVWSLLPRKITLKWKHDN